MSDERVTAEQRIAVVDRARGCCEYCSQNQEGMDIDASATQVRAAASLGSLPLVVLTHGQGARQWPPDFPADVVAKLEQEWQAMQKEIASLSSNSTQIIAKDSGHDIQVDQPDLVVDAIHRVVDATRSK